MFQEVFEVTSASLELIVSRSRKEPFVRKKSSLQTFQKREVAMVML